MGIRKRDQTDEKSEKIPLLTINKTTKTEKVKKSPRIYDHVSMGSLAENLVGNPKPWEI